MVCTKGQSISLIDTLDRHLNQTSWSILSWSTVSWKSAEFWLIYINRQLISWLSANCQPRCQRSVNWVSAEVYMECRRRVLIDTWLQLPLAHMACSMLSQLNQSAAPQSLLNLLLHNKYILLPCNLGMDGSRAWSDRYLKQQVLKAQASRELRSHAP